MGKLLKVKLGLLVASCIVASNVTMALAAESVTETKDNITITKQAQWSSLDGKKTDDKGNPYAQINFRIDTTNASDKVINVVTKAGDADVIIVLDNSGSMGKEFDAAKEAAADFATKMLDIDAYNVKVGLVTMGSTGVRAVEPTADKALITNTIKNLQFDPVMWGTNFQDALYQTQNMLGSSSAPNKLVVFQSDGVPEQCYKTVNCMKITGDNIATGKNDSECAINQTNILKKLYPDVKLATIGYKHGTSNHSVLKEMSSKDENGNMMFFEATARANVTQYLGSLADAFKSTQDTFNNIIAGNTLVDKVPSEYEIVASSIKTNDTKVVGKVDEAKNLVTFTWDQKIEKKVYELSFVIKLNSCKVPANYITEKREIYTNGTTIDVTKDSTNSAVFYYGSDGKIGLKSPTLKLEEDIIKVVGNGLNTADGQQAQVALVDKSPKTGDEFSMAILCAGIAAIVVGAVSYGVIRKRR